jgi:chromosome segregation protein
MDKFNKTTKESTKELTDIKTKLTTCESDLSETREKFSNLEQEQKSLKDLKDKLNEEITSLKSNKAELEKNLSDAKEEISNLEQFKESDAKLGKVKEDLEQKEREIENIKKQLQQTISDKYIEIESLKNDNTQAISEKESEVIDLKSQIEEHSKEMDALNLKIRSLEDFIEEAKSYPQVVEEIKDTMAHKGFLSDKELDEILDRNRNE